MSNGRSQRGFSLIEAMVATVLVAVGVVAVYGAMSAITRTEHRTRQHEVLQRLAEDKYDEIVTTEATLTAPQNGNFSDRNLPKFTWKLESVPSGVENLQALTVRVQADQNDAKSPEGIASGLVYIHPQTTTGATQ